MDVRRGILAAIVLIILSVTVAFSQRTTRIYDEPETEPPERQVDMLHMRLEVSFLPEQGLVRGTVTHRFSSLRPRVDTLFLHGPGIRVRSARLNGKGIQYQSTPPGIVFRFQKPLTRGGIDSLTIDYEATPRRGIYFIGWNDSTGRSRRQIWTQGQGIDNRHWFPCHDEQNDKLTTETIVTVRTGLQVLSNGDLVLQRPNGNGTTTWHYRMTKPHSTYLVMLGIGSYGIDRRVSRRGTPLGLYYYPEFPERVEPTYRYSAEMIDFMEDETGVPYPWGSYSQIPVQDFLYGAMENTTATVYGDFLHVDPRGYLDNNYVSVNVHELAHQWFGDYVTGRSGVQSWLHESFATFYPKLFFRKISGEDEYQWIRRREQDAALAASRNDRFPILHSRGGRDRVYAKGSAVLDMAMHVWGEDSFRKVINHYLRGHAYGLVETRDLYQAFQDVLGVTPRWFFEQWIIRGGEPHYRVTTRDIAERGATGRETEILVEQIHPTDELVGLFTMPIRFEVHYADGSNDSLLQTISRQTERVVIPKPKGKKVAFVLFDPGSMVLKSLTYPRRFEELAAQAGRAPLMIDRYDALVAMREIPVEEKRTLLTERFSREPFYGIRGEIISQLAADRESIPLLWRALADPAAHVRRTGVESIGMAPRELRESVEALLHDSSYAVTAKALRLITDQFPERAAAALDATRGIGGVGNQVRVLWLEIRGERGDLASLDSLVDMAGPSFEFRTRVNALEALRRLDYAPTLLIRHLVDAMLHPNGRLRGPATEVAASFMRESAIRGRFIDYCRSRTWLPWQEAILSEACK